MNNDTRNFIPFQGICSEKCPQGFAILSTNDSDSTCHKVCQNVSFSDDRVSDDVLKHIEGCEIVQGFLEIRNISENYCYEKSSIYFEDFIASIIEIDGFLKIENSNLFTDLKSFINLKRITGKTLISEKYSVMIKGNQNLNYLWLDNQNLTIDGESLIESNPNFCSNCSEISDFEAVFKLYTANFTWKLPENFNSSEKHKYRVRLWNGTSQAVCDDKR